MLHSTWRHGPAPDRADPDFAAARVAPFRFRRRKSESLTILKGARGELAKHAPRMKVSITVLKKNNLM